MEVDRKIDHIGIAVKDIHEVERAYSALFGEGSETEVVEGEGVKTKFFKAGDARMELLESAKEGSAIQRSIEKRGEGLHHIAIQVEDIEDEMERLKELGLKFTTERPTTGAGGHKVAFVHPKSLKILLELVEM
jgi:methylmalonyl-CoA/ethylmalonyl-CoA epimerase